MNLNQLLPNKETISWSLSSPISDCKRWLVFSLFNVSSWHISLRNLGERCILLQSEEHTNSYAQQAQREYLCFWSVSQSIKKKVPLTYVKRYRKRENVKKWWNDLTEGEDPNTDLSQPCKKHFECLWLLHGWP
jgi:hypothetical protein